jgi:hypothetical protein
LAKLAATSAAPAACLPDAASFRDAATRQAWNGAGFLDGTPQNRAEQEGMRIKPRIPFPSIRRNAGLFVEFGGFRSRLFCAIVPDRCYGETGRMEEMLG